MYSIIINVCSLKTYGDNIFGSAISNNKLYDQFLLLINIWHT